MGGEVGGGADVRDSLINRRAVKVWCDVWFIEFEIPISRINTSLPDAV